MFRQSKCQCGGTLSYWVNAHDATDGADCTGCDQPQAVRYTDDATEVMKVPGGGIEIGFLDDRVVVANTTVGSLYGLDYGQALELHRQLGVELGLHHPAPKSPLTASRATASQRSAQWKP